MADEGGVHDPGHRGRLPLPLPHVHADPAVHHDGVAALDRVADVLAETAPAVDGVPGRLPVHPGPGLVVARRGADPERRALGLPHVAHVHVAADPSLQGHIALVHLLPPHRSWRQSSGRPRPSRRTTTRLWIEDPDDALCACEAVRLRALRRPSQVCRYAASSAATGTITSSSATSATPARNRLSALRARDFAPYGDQHPREQGQYDAGRDSEHQHQRRHRETAVVGRLGDRHLQVGRAGQHRQPERAGERGEEQHPLEHPHHPAPQRRARRPRGRSW